MTSPGFGTSDSTPRALGRHRGNEPVTCRHYRRSTHRQAGEADDGAAYTVDWAGLRGLTNGGVIGPAKKALVSGSRVVVTGNRIRTAAEIRQHFPDFKSDVNPNVLDLSSIRRVGDSFSWALPPRQNPPNCGRQ